MRLIQIHVAAYAAGIEYGDSQPVPAAGLSMFGTDTFAKENFLVKHDKRGIVAMCYFSGKSSRSVPQSCGSQVPACGIYACSDCCTSFSIRIFADSTSTDSDSRPRALAIHVRAQFYITYAAHPVLNFKSVAFGQVTSSTLHVLDKLEKELPVFDFEDKDEVTYHRIFDYNSRFRCNKCWCVSCFLDRCLAL